MYLQRSTHFSFKRWNKIWKWRCDKTIWFIFAFFSVSIHPVCWHAIEFSHTFFIRRFTSYVESQKKRSFFVWHLFSLTFACSSYIAKKSKWNWNMLLEHCSTHKELLRRRRALKTTIAIISVLWNMFKNKTYILAGLVVKYFFELSKWSYCYSRSL